MIFWRKKFLILNISFAFDFKFTLKVNLTLKGKFIAITKFLAKNIFQKFSVKFFQHSKVIHLKSPYTAYPSRDHLHARENIQPKWMLNNLLHHNNYKFAHLYSRSRSKLNNKHRKRKLGKNIKIYVKSRVTSATIIMVISMHFIFIDEGA